MIREHMFFSFVLKMGFTNFEYMLNFYETFHETHVQHLYFIYVINISIWNVLKIYKYTC